MDKRKSSSKTTDAKPIAIRRKPKTGNTTQSSAKKPRPLTDFLKTATSEKPKIMTNIKLSNDKNTGSCEIVEILEEDDARDTWTVTYNTDSITSNTIANSNSCETVQDKTMTEIPEDFKLIMDDHSQAESIEKSSKLGEDLNMDVDAPEKISNFSSEYTTDSSKNLKEQEVIERKCKDLPKTPRRVPLITLSSPSHQKKRPE